MHGTILCLYKTLRTSTVELIFVHTHTRKRLCKITWDLTELTLHKSLGDNIPPGSERHAFLCAKTETLHDLYITFFF